MSNNQIDASGIQIQSYSDIVNDIINGTPTVPGYVQIYGADINTASNTPDGQQINIFALSKQDILDLIVQDYDSKDPDQAVGSALDGVSQLCGIARKGGTYTQVNVDITVSINLNLAGQDTSSPFTVSDSNGNLFYLIASASLTIGVNTLAFQAANVGFIQVLANTITTVVTSTAGVSSVNNSSTPYQIGADQETDSNLRLRRQRSVALPAKGTIGGLYGGLYSIVGLNQAKIYENQTNATNADNVPAHSIWVVVDGGSATDVANTIFLYRSMGCGMYGGQTQVVTDADGNPVTIMWDNAVYQDLSIYLHVSSLSGGSIDIASLQNALAAQYVLGINQVADSTSVTALIHTINPDLLVTTCLVSGDRITYAQSVAPLTKMNRFVLTVANISVLDPAQSSSSSSSCRSSSSSSRSSSSSSSSCRSSSSSSCSSSSKSSSSSSSSHSSSSSSCRSSSSSCSSSSCRSSSCSSSSSAT